MSDTSQPPAGYGRQVFIGADMKHRHSKGAPTELHATARKMGRKIADLGGSGEAVTEADLLTDFSAADIKQHIEAARDYARALLGKRADQAIERSAAACQTLRNGVSRLDDAIRAGKMNPGKQAKALESLKLRSSSNTQAL